MSNILQTTLYHQKIPIFSQKFLIKKSFFFGYKVRHLLYDELTHSYLYFLLKVIIVFLIKQKAVADHLQIWNNFLKHHMF